MVWTPIFQTTLIICVFSDLKLHRQLCQDYIWPRYLINTRRDIDTTKIYSLEVVETVYIPVTLCAHHCSQKDKIIADWSPNRGACMPHGLATLNRQCCVALISTTAYIYIHGISGCMWKNASLFWRAQKMMVIYVQWWLEDVGVR